MKISKANNYVTLIKTKSQFSEKSGQLSHKEVWGLMYVDSGLNINIQ